MGLEDLRRAAAAWNLADESLPSVEQRIHDGVPVERLEERADAYVQQIFAPFAQVRAEQLKAALEIGSGVGTIMEGVDRYAAARGNPSVRIDGLDIAEHMIAHAKERLGPRAARYGFVHYDGVDVPLPDRTYDLVYSVAALQHVPKPFVYNLFFEIRRLLTEPGRAVLMFLGYRSLPRHARWNTWRNEVDIQIGRRNGPHHYFYAAEELHTILAATGFSSIDVRDGEQIWVCVGG
jgi:SAM-dependent methyltransferase